MQALRNGLVGDAGELALVPFGYQRVAPLHGCVEAIREHGHALREGDDVAHPGDGARRAVIDGDQPGAGCGWARQRGGEHTRQAHIEAELAAAVDLRR